MCSYKRKRLRSNDLAQKSKSINKYIKTKTYLEGPVLKRLRAKAEIDDFSFHLLHAENLVHRSNNSPVESTVVRITRLD